jgi:hypothetical protein
MYTKGDPWLSQPCLRALILGIIAALTLNPIFTHADTNALIIYWVFDVSTANSQFGYWDNAVSEPVGGIFNESDFEGIGCVGTTIYVTSGKDGNAPSQLARLTFTKDSDTTTITDSKTIQDANGNPFYEVASLGIRSDNTLWAFAAIEQAGSGGSGIIQIDPATGLAELKQASTLDVAAVTWLGNTLYLAAQNKMYSWTEGGAISDVLFEVNSIAEIEALDTTPNGTFYIGGDGSVVQEIQPNGTQVNAQVFAVTDRDGNSGDPESLTFCQALDPTALEESDEPLQAPTSLEEDSEPVRTLSTTYLPIVRQ